MTVFESQHRKLIGILADAVMDGQAWGSVLLPDGFGGKRGATLGEAEEALCEVMDRLRGDPTDPSMSLANVNAAYVVERDEAQRLARENERLRAENLRLTSSNMARDDVIFTVRQHLEAGGVTFALAAIASYERGLALETDEEGDSDAADR